MNGRNVMIIYSLPPFVCGIVDVIVDGWWLPVREDKM